MGVNRQKESRSSIISAVDSPLKLAALALLIVEVLLIYLAHKGDDKHIPLYFGLIVLTIIIAIVTWYKWKKIEPRIIPTTGGVEKSSKEFVYDVFLAAPMSAVGDMEFEDFNAKMKDIQTLLKTECGFKSVFYAGENIVGWEDFDSGAVALTDDIDALKNSRLFVLVYPERIVSSVLFEAGAAYVYGKPTFYFGKSENFPYLMKEAENSDCHIRKYQIESVDDLARLIKRHGRKLFSTKKDC